MLNLRNQRGFTIIELMVAVTILGIVTALALPTFGGMIQNSKIGSSAKSYLIGLQAARAEAIRHNSPVEFVLTDSAITAATLVPSTTGKNWVVQWIDPANVAAGYVRIEAKSALEGSGRTSSSTVDVLGAAISGTFNGTVTFNGLGGTTSGVTLDISNPVGGPCAPTGPMRCQRVQVRPGGQINVCDPAAATTDSRACL